MFEKDAKSTHKKERKIRMKKKRNSTKSNPLQPRKTQRPQTKKIRTILQQQEDTPEHHQQQIKIEMPYTFRLYHRKNATDPSDQFEPASQLEEHAGADRTRVGREPAGRARGFLLSMRRVLPAAPSVEVNLPLVQYTRKKRPRCRSIHPRPQPQHVEDRRAAAGGAGFGASTRAP